jgi:hypothetical protein
VLRFGTHVRQSVDGTPDGSSVRFPWDLLVDLDLVRVLAYGQFWRGWLVVSATQSEPRQTDREGLTCAVSVECVCSDGVGCELVNFLCHGF